MNTELTNKKIELLKKIAKKDKTLEKHLEDLLKFYGEDGVITNNELQDIIDSVQEKTNELENNELQEKLTKAIEEVKKATPDTINKVEEEIEESLELDAPVVQEEQVIEDKPIEEHTFDDSTKEKSDKLVQSCANSNVQAEVKPGDKAHYGYDTFSIVVSKTSQHILDSLKRLQVFAAYDITFEIVNGNYVMNVLNNGKGDANNITSLENMIDTISNYVSTASKNNDYLSNMKEEHALVQEKYENEHPVAKELYEKQSISEDLTQYNDNASVISAYNNSDQEEINHYSDSNNDDFSYTDNGNDSYSIYDEEGNEVTTGTETYDEEKSNRELSDDAPAKVNSSKTLVRTLGIHPSANSHGLVTIATLIMGIGLAIGLIVLFISLA